MTRAETDEYLSSMSDAELRQSIAKVKEDLAEAAQHQPSSERHESCFAAAFLYAEEAQRRGLIIATVH